MGKVILCKLQGCGRTFERPKGKVAMMYCEEHRKSPVSKQKAYYRRAKYGKRCPHCGTLIERHQDYCSKACQHISERYNKFKNETPQHDYRPSHYDYAHPMPVFNSFGL